MKKLSIVFATLFVIAALFIVVISHGYLDPGKEMVFFSAAFLSSYSYSEAPPQNPLVIGKPAISEYGFAFSGSSPVVTFRAGTKTYQIRTDTISEAKALLDLLNQAESIQITSYREVSTEFSWVNMFNIRIKK